MKSYEYIDKLHRLDWLSSIAKEYEEGVRFLEKNGKDVTITGISYDYHGHSAFCLNNHRSIDPSFILSGIEKALGEIRTEIDALEKELKSVTVEL